MRAGTAGTEWERTWRAVELAGRSAQAQPARAGLLAALAGGFATLLGTSLGTDLRPTWAQVAAATAVAALTLSVVVVAMHGTGFRAHLVVLTAAFLSTGAAAIHFAVIQSHFDEWWGFGAFFVASGVAQLGWSLLVVTWPSRPLFWIGVFGNAAIVALWIVTRTEGTLVGPDPREPEPVGVADGISTGFEIGIVALALSLALLGVPRRQFLRAFAWIAGTATLALTTVGLLSAIGAAPGVIPPIE
jgi:hypothetical protein